MRLESGWAQVTPLLHFWERGSFRGLGGGTASSFSGASKAAPPWGLPPPAWGPGSGFVGFIPGNFWF